MLILSQMRGFHGTILPFMVDTWVLFCTDIVELVGLIQYVTHRQKSSTSTAYTINTVFLDTLNIVL